PRVAAIRNALTMLQQRLSTAPATPVPHDQALSSHRETSGEDPPQGAIVAGPAELQQRLEDLRAARMMFERALALDVKAYGDDHRQVAMGRIKLAALLYELGELPAARVLFEQALASDRNMYGDDHAQVATDRNNLARLLHELGELSAARVLFE